MLQKHPHNTGQKKVYLNISYLDIQWWSIKIYATLIKFYLLYTFIEDLNEIEKNLLKWSVSLIFLN